METSRNIKNTEPVNVGLTDQADVEFFLRLKESFSNGKGSEDVRVLISVCSTRAIETKTRITDNCNRLACDLGSLQFSILTGLADRYAILAHELLDLEKNTINPVQGFNVEGRFLVPNVDLEIMKNGFHLNDSQKKLLIDAVELFFMMATSYPHRSQQGDMFNQLSEHQLAILEKNVDEFLTTFGTRKISPPLKIIGLGQEKPLSGKFLPRKINEDINKDPYYIQAYFNGYILSEHELCLIMPNGDKLVVFYNPDIHFEAVSGLAAFRHELTIFNVSDLAGKKNGKTINLVNIEGQVDPLAKMMPPTRA